MNDFKTVPFTPILTDTICVSTFHMNSISIVRSYILISYWRHYHYFFIFIKTLFTYRFCKIKTLYLKNTVNN